MISFTLPIAFSVICTMLSIYSWIVGKSWSPLYRWDRITPTFNHLDGALWDSVAEKSTLNSARGQNWNPGTGTDRAAQANSRQRAPEIHGSLAGPRRAIVQSVSAETR